MRYRSPGYTNTALDCRANCFGWAVLGLRSDILKISDVPPSTIRIFVFLQLSDLNELRPNDDILDMCCQPVLERSVEREILALGRLARNGRAHFGGNIY
jgi:hypothetical protein